MKINKITIFIIVLVFYCLFTKICFCSTFNVKGIPTLKANSSIKWLVYIDAKQKIIDNIQCVIYMLDPSFAYSIREVCNNNSSLYPFSVTLNSYGSFQVKAKVIHKDGTALVKTVYLDLDSVNKTKNIEKIDSLSITSSPNEIFSYNNLFEQLKESTESFKKLLTGDIILRLSSDVTSVGIAIATLSGFSHVGILLREDTKIYVIDVEPAKEKINKVLLEDWIKDTNNNSVDIKNVIQLKVLRYKDKINRNLIKQLITKQLQTKINFSLNKSIANSLYCSSFIESIYKIAANNYLPLISSNQVINNVYKSLVQISLYYQGSKKFSDFVTLIKQKKGKIADDIKQLPEVIAPGSFEWSNQFNTITHVQRDIPENSNEAIKLYKTIYSKIQIVKSLNGIYGEKKYIEGLLKQKVINDFSLYNIIHSVVFKQKSKVLKINSNEIIYEYLLDLSKKPSLFEIFFQ